MNSEMKSEKFDTALAAKILDDPDLSKWFFDVCMGLTPEIKLSDELVKKMERHKFVLKTNLGLQLGPAGEEFARKLGLSSDKDRVDLIPILIDYMTGRNSKTPRKDKKGNSECDKENK